jgi:hypothetical protein
VKTAGDKASSMCCSLGWGSLNSSHSLSKFVLFSNWLRSSQLKEVFVLLFTCVCVCGVMRSEGVMSSEKDWEECVILEL